MIYIKIRLWVIKKIHKNNRKIIKYLTEGLILLMNYETTDDVECITIHWDYKHTNMDSLSNLRSISTLLSKDMKEITWEK